MILFNFTPSHTPIIVVCMPPKTKKDKIAFIISLPFSLIKFPVITLIVRRKNIKEIPKKIYEILLSFLGNSVVCPNQKINKMTGRLPKIPTIKNSSKK